MAVPSCVAQQDIVKLMGFGGCKSEVQSFINAHLSYPKGLAEFPARMTSCGPS